MEMTLGQAIDWAAENCYSGYIHCVGPGASTLGFSHGNVTADMAFLCDAAMLAPGLTWFFEDTKGTVIIGKADGGLEVRPSADV